MSNYETQAMPEERVALRTLLDSAERGVRSAHELIDELEDRVGGPRPRPASRADMIEKTAVPAPHPGIRANAVSLDNEAMRLVQRLNDLLSQI